MTLPVLLLTRGRRALVVGGGPVGRRKARAALAGGLAVTLVCLDPRPADFPDAAEWVIEEYNEGHLDGVDLAFAAGPPGVNCRVVADARSRRVPVNSASDPEAGDFFMPAVHRDGGVTVAVSTDGDDPAAAKEMRDRVADFLLGGSNQ